MHPGPPQRLRVDVSPPREGSSSSPCMFNENRRTRIHMELRMSEVESRESRHSSHSTSRRTLSHSAPGRFPGGPEERWPTAPTLSPAASTAPTPRTWSRRSPAPRSTTACTGRSSASRSRPSRWWTRRSSWTTSEARARSRRTGPSVPPSIRPPPLRHWGITASAACFRSEPGR